MLVDATWLDDREVLHSNVSNGGMLVKVDGGRVAKVFPYKGWFLGWVRILCQSTKAHKQAKSMRRLLGLGLNTPEPLEVISFRPKGGRFEGALVYQFVEGVTEARDALKTPLREKILLQLADELVVMAKAGVLFLDLHFGNILVDAQGELCWIDVEVKEGEDLVKGKFWSRVVRLHQKCDPGVMSEEEWRFLCERIKEGLPEDVNFQGEPVL